MGKLNGIYIQESLKVILESIPAIYGDDGGCPDGIRKNHGGHQLFKGTWELGALYSA